MHRAHNADVLSNDAAVTAASPVTTITSIPRRRSSAMHDATSGRGGSLSVTTPQRHMAPAVPIATPRARD
jgi:hypothetical protein